MDYLIGIKLQAACFIIVIFIGILFFSATRIKRYTNITFAALLFTMPIYLILDAMTVITVNFFADTYTNHIAHRFFLFFLAVVVYLFFIHVDFLVYEEGNAPRIRKTGKIIALVVLVVTQLHTWFVPVSVEKSYVLRKGSKSGYASVDFAIGTYIAVVLFLLMILICMIISWKKLLRKTKLAIVTVICIEGLGVAMQFFHTELLLSGFMLTMMVLAFYLILDNPDTQLLREVQAEKKLVEEKEAELEIANTRISIQALQALAKTIDAKDRYTNGHSMRVAEYSKMLAERLGLEEQKVTQIYNTGLLHDIGKIGIRDTIINKEGKLSQEEFDEVKLHPIIGYEILKEMTEMKDLSFGARLHHEHYDGSGYPDGLKGEDIPIESRIICVADCYDAMTSNRSYRKYLPQEVVRSELVNNSGTQFDPEIARIMIDIIDNDKEYIFHEQPEDGKEK